jgi:hypothetical protein
VKSRPSIGDTRIVRRNRGATNTSVTFSGNGPEVSERSSV